MTEQEFWMQLYLSYAQHGDNPAIAKQKADEGIAHLNAFGVEVPISLLKKQVG